MTVKVRLTAKAEKQLDSFREDDPAGVDSLLDALILLEKDPRPAGAVPYGPGNFRIRSGFYRALYEVEDDTIIVVTVWHVGRSYRP